ncbi:Fe-only nitrogenase accessory protein AnfO [Brooklawnia cerclae]|uniref:Fe-only nitrogenase accessory protein AnfO n=1 Tax=Brooklawnia cerclae TaxID=349934 RepID=A0ABX0SIR9_9ACTN|nr:Fe-only nitrogenase accessory AnfO family protein [Brooklawnia cerclae]NIH57809.1 Fe-only nitrogenase accessory protein AnfO [Brooklawnia cerclae]
MKIAALLDQSGRAASPKRGGTIYVYEREGDTWSSSQRLEFFAGECDSMDDLRAYFATVTEWLGDCQVLAARAANGYYRVAFGSLGVVLWEVNGYPEQFVQEIERFYAQARAAAPAETIEPIAVIEPVPERAGHYRVDLREAMAVKGAHNSRQVLLPFFREANFLRLDIICDHVPRWFSDELPTLGLRADVESHSDLTRVHVHPVKSSG